MFNLYCFAGEDPEMAFNIIDGTAKYNDDYVKENSFDTKEGAEKRMDNLGSRWIFYPNRAITETVGNKEILIGMYMADGDNYTLNEEEYEAVKREANMI